MSSCCAPGRSSGGDERGASIPAGTGRPPAVLVPIPGGSFRMGANGAQADDGDGEGPVHVVELSPYRLGAHAVTNDEYAAFVDATGHVTEAERYGWSFVFVGHLPDEFPDTAAVAQAPWWRQVFGADWRHPHGPQSDLEGRGRHPVVHVAWTDATAYCAWQRTRLPTEAEWERAARGGHEGRVFPWGDELEPGGRHAMNVFQGTFPAGDSGADGYTGTAPVDSYAANDLGLFNMTGNVWEWCNDWFSRDYYRNSAKVDPPGPAAGTQRVMRGGSYLCHESYCRRYRVAARSANSPDSSTGNLGFRVAAAPDDP